MIVVGAGHAGVEAVLAAVRLGCSVAMLTQNLDTIAAMSCNPAIGGLAKGHMVRGIKRFKTGIPCRLNMRSIDFSKCECQDSAPPPPLFSFLAARILRGDDDSSVTLNVHVFEVFHVELCGLKPSTIEIGFPAAQFDCRSLDRALIRLALISSSWVNLLE